MANLKTDNLFFRASQLVSRVVRNTVADSRQPASSHLSPFTFHLSSPRSGFTLVELLVVIAMLMLLVGAVSSSVSSAQRRAKIAQATAEAQEMTNAILAYQHFGEDYKLPTLDNVPATETTLSFILGGGKGPTGETIPVLYNASVKGGQILDPWMHPYYVTIRAGKTINTEEDSTDNLKSYVAFPNFNRRPADN